MGDFQFHSAESLILTNDDDAGHMSVSGRSSPLDFLAHASANAEVEIPLSKWRITAMTDAGKITVVAGPGGSNVRLHRGTGKLAPDTSKPQGAKKCRNRECNNLGGQAGKPRSIYCSKRCQSREQNLRQGRIKNVGRNINTIARTESRSPPSSPTNTSPSSANDSPPVETHFTPPQSPSPPKSQVAVETVVSYHHQPPPPSPSPPLSVRYDFGMPYTGGLTPSPIPRLGITPPPISMTPTPPPFSMAPSPILGMSSHGHFLPVTMSSANHSDGVVLPSPGLHRPRPIATRPVSSARINAPVQTTQIRFNAPVAIKKDASDDLRLPPMRE